VTEFLIRLLRLLSDSSDGTFVLMHLTVCFCLRYRFGDTGTAEWFPGVDRESGGTVAAMIGNAAGMHTDESGIHHFHMSVPRNISENG
jgi:hypothetical protein